MSIRGWLWLALAAAVVYSVWEIRRWQGPIGRELFSPRQRRWRLWGLFFLVLSLGLWLNGTYLPIPRGPLKTRAERLAGLRLIEYWTLTAVCALPLIPLAVLDSRENLRRLNDERRKLLDERAELVDDFLRPELLEDDSADRSKPAP